MRSLKLNKTDNRIVSDINSYIFILHQKPLEGGHGWAWFKVDKCNIAFYNFFLNTQMFML
jgi:hypothetical protein